MKKLSIVVALLGFSSFSHLANADLLYWKTDKASLKVYGEVSFMAAHENEYRDTATKTFDKGRYRTRINFSGRTFLDQNWSLEAYVRASHYKSYTQNKMHYYDTHKISTFPKNWKGGNITFDKATLAVGYRNLGKLTLGFGGEDGVVGANDVWTPANYLYTPDTALTKTLGYTSPNRLVKWQSTNWSRRWQYGISYGDNRLNNPDSYFKTFEGSLLYSPERNVEYRLFAAHVRHLVHDKAKNSDSKYSNTAFGLLYKYDIRPYRFQVQADYGYSDQPNSRDKFNWKRWSLTGTAEYTAGELFKPYLTASYYYNKGKDASQNDVYKLEDQKALLVGFNSDIYRGTPIQVTTFIEYSKNWSNTENQYYEKKINKYIWYNILNRIFYIWNTINNICIKNN